MWFAAHWTVRVYRTADEVGANTGQSNPEMVDREARSLPKLDWSRNGAHTFRAEAWPNYADVSNDV